MSTANKSFTAVGTGPILHVRRGESFTYDLSGTFSGTAVLERSRTGGAAWETLVTATAAASGTIVNESPDSSSEWYRWRCTARASGTLVTSLADVADVVQAVRNRQGDVVHQISDDGVAITGTLAVSGTLTPAGSVVRTSQKRIVSAAGCAKAGATAGFVVAAGDNVALVTCPQSQTGSTLVVPITGMKVGDTITSFHLIGQIESGGNAVTVDAALRKMTAAAADVTDASVGAITQLSVTADTIMSESNTNKASLTEVVGADETFYVLITVTTGASTDVALHGVAVTVTEG